MKKRDLYLLTGLWFVTFILIQLLKFLLKPESNTLNNISFVLLGMGIVFLLVAIFKKEKK